MIQNSFGIKVSTPSKNIKSVNIEDFVINSKYPVRKCDMTSDPLHYGFLKTTLASVAPGEIVTLFTLEHNLGYMPQYEVSWYFAEGTSITANPNTYGIGTLETTIDDDFFNIVVYEPIVDETYFKIRFYNYAGNTKTATNYKANFKYYIYSDDLTDATY